MRWQFCRKLSTFLWDIFHFCSRSCDWFTTFFAKHKRKLWPFSHSRTYKNIIYIRSSQGLFLKRIAWQFILTIGLPIFSERRKELPSSCDHPAWTVTVKHSHFRACETTLFQLGILGRAVYVIIASFWWIFFSANTLDALFSKSKHGLLTHVSVKHKKIQEDNLKNHYVDAQSRIFRSPPKCLEDDFVSTE